ncbi:PQQ-binding-like beta-propeller repeat protein [Amycolatopsis sp. NPDC051045]|uniref:WD40 repeat domain-containing protein n=1 Tax=Amycolatopsis sp. NPDC051045 TaxID=3156922 RepID=UPI00342BDBA5
MSASAALRRLWRAGIQGNAPFPAVAFAPSGEWIVAGTQTGTGTGHSLGQLTVLDRHSGTVLRQIGDDWQIVDVAVSPDSRWLATSEFHNHPGGPDGPRVRVLDAETFAPRCQFTGTLDDRSSQLLGFTPDGGSVVAQLVAFGSPSARAYRFDVATGRELWRRELRLINQMAFSGDARTVAVAFADGIAILDTDSGAVVRQLGSLPEIRRIAHSPDNRRIVGGAADGTLHAFDAASGAPLWTVQRITEHDESVVRVAISADSRWVAAHRTVSIPDAHGVPGMLTVHDLDRGTLRFPPVELGFFGDLAYSPTLRHVAVNLPLGWPAPPAPANGISVIDARTGRPHVVSANGAGLLAFSPDGTTLATGGEPFIDLYDVGIEVSRLEITADPAALAMSDGGTPVVAVADDTPAVTVFAARTGVTLAKQPIPGAVTGVAFADGGQAVAVSSTTGVRLFSIIGDRFWTVEALGPVNALAAVGPAGASLAVAAGKSVRLLNSADGTGRWTAPSAHPQTVTRVAANADGTRIATACADHRTRVLDAAIGAELFAVAGDGAVRALAFAPTTTLLATGNDDGTVIVIDAVAGVERGRTRRLFGVSRLAFSVDATLLAVAWDDNTVAVLDLTAAGEPPAVRVIDCGAPISLLAVNPADRSVAVVTSGSSTVTVHDTASGLELARVLHPRPVRAMAFSRDGTLLATASDDHVVRITTSGLPPATP